MCPDPLEGDYDRLKQAENVGLGAVKPPPRRAWCGLPPVTSVAVGDQCMAEKRTRLGMQTLSRTSAGAVALSMRCPLLNTQHCLPCGNRILYIAVVPQLGCRQLALRAIHSPVIRAYHSFILFGPDTVRNNDLLCPAGYLAQAAL